MEIALQTCQNIDIENMVMIADFLLHSGRKKKRDMKKLVTRIGEQFEFHRESFNKDSVDSVSLALDKLYNIFKVTPVPRRITHDNNSEFKIKEKTWEKQHQELWKLLVPSSGHARTVQGELIRISGRVSNEIEDNDSTNWDAEYKKMCIAFIELIITGQSLQQKEINEIKLVISSKQKLSGNTYILAKNAVKWVLQNRKPIPLPDPDYSR